MSRITSRGPKLPKHLLDQFGDGSGRRSKRGEVSRKDRRKAERQEKKGARPWSAAIREAPRQHTEHTYVHKNSNLLNPTSASPKQSSSTQVPKGDAKPLRSILKPSKREPEFESGSEASTVDEATSSNISKGAALRGLEDDDDEIASLERRLGVKSKKKGKAVADVELDWLVGGSDSEEDLDLQGSNRKRKRETPEDTDWLRDKRLKANGTLHNETSVDEDGSDQNDDLESGSNTSGSEFNEDEDLNGLGNPFSDDEVSDGDFEGFESGGNEDQATDSFSKHRENPYVAPVTKGTAAVDKYVPPSLRKPAASDEETLKQLRRQLQGQLNRLSEANLLSILQAIEGFYQNNARQHVTSVLIDLLVGSVADPSTLNDTFLILHAGFVSALYKVVGTDFGAQTLEHIIRAFDEHYAVGGSHGKQSLNLVAFLANLYTLQVIGSTIIFDYIRLLLEELSENNTELLLRIIRTSGTQLRHDDPSSLKDIVLLLQRSVAQVGEANLSVRTKFMIETINDLKNNRVKTGVSASQVVAEHTTRMRKTLGTLNTRAKVNEPLRIGLADIKDSEKKGKWWLVGASYHDPAKLATNGPSHAQTALKQDDIDAGYESETPNNPTNLQKLARAQGMNTDIRRAIFVSILSASDYQDAHVRLLKLHLKSKQELEIPRVLLHCAGAEKVYNPYYTLIARKLCEERRLEKAFRFALMSVLRELGAGLDGDDDENEADEEGATEKMSTTKIVNLAKFYGSLVANGGQNITVLKSLEFGFLRPKTQMFAEVLLTKLFWEVDKKGKDKDEFVSGVSKVFEQAGLAPEIVQGLQYFLAAVVAKSEIAGGKRETKVVRKGCKIAQRALADAAETAPLGNGSSEGEADE